MSRIHDRDSSDIVDYQIPESYEPEDKYEMISMSGQGCSVLSGVTGVERIFDYMSEWLGDVF